MLVFIEIAFLFVGGFVAGFLFIEIARLLVSIVKSIRIKRWTWESSGIGDALTFGLCIAISCPVCWIVSWIIELIH